MTDFSPIAPLIACDAYKLSHIRQYELAGNVTRIYSNYTNRKSRMKGVNHVVHFGLQGYIHKHLMEEFEPFFNYPSTGAVMAMYKEFLTQVLGQEAADIIGADHIGDLHELGYLPLRFCGLPEGTLVPTGVPCWTVENTHDDFAWLPGYRETDLSAGYWHPSTVATIAHQYRLLLDAAAKATGADPADVDHQGHDFAYRGMVQPEAIAPAGAAHLLSFNGSDSLPALPWIEKYYGGAPRNISIVATEHSSMSLGTATIGEFEMYKRLLDLHPTGTLAIVSDTYDLWRVITEYLPRLKDQIMARDGKLLIRPDSGKSPEIILCGDPDDRGAPQKGVVRLLFDIFGGTANKAGLINLDPHIGTVYGDSITLQRAAEISARLEGLGWVSTTAGYGIGSFTYQYLTRDTFGSAVKATWAEVDGKGVNVFKDPITDDGTKKSATGRLAVLRRAKAFGGELFLVEKADKYAQDSSLLQPVWEDGKFLRHQTFQEVREILNR